MFIVLLQLALAGPAVTVQGARPTHGSVIGHVSAPVEVVRDAAADCERFPAWFPDMRDTHVVAQVGDVTRCRGRMDLPWPLADRTWEVLLQASDRVVDGRSATVVTFTYVEGSGNVDELSGRFVLHALPAGGTRVHYQARVDLGFWLPAFVLTWATERILPGIIEGLERESARRAALQSGQLGSGAYGWGPRPVE